MARHPVMYPSLLAARTVLVRAGVMALAVCVTALAGVAHAGTVSFSGDVLTYNAAAGEGNLLDVRHGRESFLCDSRPAPCLLIDDSGAAITSFPAGRCALQDGTLRCDLPSSVVVNLGDMNDLVRDWDGPSQINGASGSDSVEGNGGNDTISGGPGIDFLAGDGGDDVLDGGDGDDSLEGTGIFPLGSTSGSDVYIGGPGWDIIDYASRDDALSISLDGVRDDGAPGEADNVGPDVEHVHGGSAGDVLVGSADANLLEGGPGNDTLRGGAREDFLFGGGDNDRLFGEDGQDVLRGENGDDVLDGGAGIDEFNGDGERSCDSCGSGMDRILARDGLNENVRCGAGEDTAILDPGDLIFLSGECEHVDRSSTGGGGTAPGGGGGGTGTVGGGTGGGTAPVGGLPGAPSAGPGSGPNVTQPTTAPRRRADPYAKCKRLKGNKKTACISKIKALKRCSKLKASKKKACVKQVTRRFSATGRR